MQTLNLVESYSAHHLPAPDCRLAAARNTLAYAGFDESYAVVSGLASCFGFTYRKAPFSFREHLQMPSCDLSAHLYPVLGSRLGALENLAYVLGGTLLGNVGQEADGSLHQMRDLVEQGIPVMACISPRVLSEFTGRMLEMPAFLSEIQFGTEWVVVSKIDDAGDRVTLFHAVSRRPVVMSVAAFQRARFDGDHTPEVLLQCRGRWAVLLLPDTLPDKRDILCAAMAKTSYHLTQDSRADRVYLGVHGVEMLAAELPRWHIHDGFTARQLKATVWMMHVQSEILSSGGMSRRLYAKFLQHAAQLLASDPLQDAATLYIKAASTWRELIDLLNTYVLGQGCTDLSECAGLNDKMLQIAELEHLAALKLQAFVRGGHA